MKDSRVASLESKRDLVHRWYNAVHEPEEKPELRAAGPILWRLEVTIDQIISHIIECYEILENAATGDFNELGALQGNAGLLDVEVARAATLIRLLPDEIRNTLQ